MQRLGGLLLMLAGVSLGAYTFLPPPIDGKQTLREVTRISAAPDRTAGGEETVASLAAGAFGTTAAVSRPASTWSAIVTAETSAQGKMRSLKPGDDGARTQLTRDLQTELKRVGCYGGDVTGSWTPSTRRAMSAFMDRVNATLPIDEPDYILLTLVQGHAEIACGASCPAGQAMGETGRCIPQAVLARDARKSQREDVIANSEAKNSESDATVAAAREPAEQLKLAEQKRAQQRERLKAVEEQRRLAAAKAAAAKAEATTKSERPTIVVEAGQERLPWLSDDLSKPAPQRPDGMMGIGGPRQQVAKAEMTEAAAAVTPDPGPRPVDLAPQPIDPPRQGMMGTKSGPAQVRGMPGTKSGPSVRNRNAYAALDQRFDAGSVERSPKKYARRAAPPLAAVKPKPKYFAANKSSRRMLARPGTNAYHMLSAMGGVF